MKWFALARIATMSLVLVLATVVHEPLLAHSDGEEASDQGEKAAIDYANAEEHAFGKAADPETAVRTIEIDMSDEMRFSPDIVEVEQGDVVRFVIRNAGRQLHEMVLGTEEELIAHAELMKKFPGMEHEEPYMAHVQPGAEGHMGWRFTNAGVYRYGCLVPGHYEAGMHGKIVVR